MKKALKIARFEFVEKARTKAYIIFVIMFPLIMGAVSVVPAILVQSNKDTPVRIGILDSTNLYGNEFIQKLKEYKLDSGMPKYSAIDLYNPFNSLEKMKTQADWTVYNNFIEGYIYIERGQSGIQTSFRQSQMFALNEIYQFENVLNQILVQHRLQQVGYQAGMINSLVSDVKLDAVQITKSRDIRSLGLQTVFFPAIVSLLLLFMLILFSGGQLIRSVMEEKSNRIMEVLLSSCTTKELLMGKVLGLGMLGLFQIFLWAVIAVLLLVFGVIPPEIFSNIELIGVYFVLGYLLYTSIFVGAGSVVTTEQEAQHFTSYISLIMTLPLVISLKVIETPNLLFVRILSYLPLTSPPVMLLRLKIMTPPVWEIILTILLLIISIYASIYISAKIFRIGILSYGKRPSFREMIRWISEK